MSGASGHRAVGDAACAAALAGLPGMGPATLHTLLSAADPVSVWAAVRSGEVVRPGGRRAPTLSWATVAHRLDVAAQWAAWEGAGVSVTWVGDGRYPSRLVEDPQPPGVVFWRGSLAGLTAPCVAVIGTRRCSPAGRSCAYHLGRELAAAGVCIVSGLALGIDGAAHQGALDGAAAAAGPGGSGRVGDGGGCGTTVGVAASGVDVVYPPRHAGLWDRVVRTGAVVSETPPGQPAHAWRFPSRNRVIAGLADLVVVVESHAAGGSMHTVEAALARGVDVRVVPGPVGSPATAGTNQLLYDGAGPVRDATDVLDALGLLRDRPARVARVRPTPVLPGLLDGPVRDDPLVEPARRGRPGAGGASGAVAGAAVDAADRAVCDAVDWAPTSVARVVARCGRPVGEVAAGLDRLQRSGAVREDGGWWSRLQ